MHSLELDNIEAVGKNAVGFAFKEMLRLVSRDMANSGKDVRAVSCRSLDTVAMVDATLAGFMINIEVLKIVVEVDGACAEVSAEKGCVGGEDCGDVDMPLSAEGDCEASLPLMEMGDDGLVQSVGGVLSGIIRRIVNRAHVGRIRKERFE